MSDTTAGDEREALAKLLYKREWPEVDWESRVTGTLVYNAYLQRADAILALAAKAEDEGAALFERYGAPAARVVWALVREIRALTDSRAAGHETGDQT